jgi:D-alanyl-D-alanine-carboxypeptidase/D-alanyl-D-alanine-endopeptidase
MRKQKSNCASQVFPVAACLLVVSYFLFQGRTPTVDAQASCSLDFSEVTTLTENLVKTVPLDGASLLLIKDGQIVYEKYFGEYTPETVVPIASASKWLSAATLMSLVDEKKLSLDDPASKYLPYFTGAKNAITLRQMFSHTSGLPGITADARCIYNPQGSLDACSRQIAALELIGPPGAQFAYGENSMHVAGRICEIVSGKSWETLFQEKIAEPLEMSDATFGPGSNPIIAGGARLKLNDYANFLRMILSGGEFKGRRVLSSASIREMQRNLTEGLPVETSPQEQTSVRYGIGEWIDLIDAGGNAIQVSSPGAFGFNPWIDQKRNLIGVFMAQSQGPRIHPTVRLIQEEVRKAVDVCAAPMTATSAASYVGGVLAPDSIAAAFGDNLATSTAAADSLPLPDSLAGTVLRMLDAEGVERLAPLFYVSPAQINFLTPPGLSFGKATLTVTNGDGALSIGHVEIALVSPGIFSANSTGTGAPAATALRVHSDGSQVYEPVAAFDPATNRFVPLPIDVSAPEDKVYLILFGGGIRNRSALSAVGLTIGGQLAQVLFAGPQDGFAGLDQINVLLPRSMAGRGEVDLQLSVEGKPANVVRIAFQ